MCTLWPGNSCQTYKNLTEGAFSWLFPAALMIDVWRGREGEGISQSDPGLIPSVLPSSIFP